MNKLILSLVLALFTGCVSVNGIKGNKLVLAKGTSIDTVDSQLEKIGFVCGAIAYIPPVSLENHEAISIDQEKTTKVKINLPKTAIVDSTDRKESDSKENVSLGEVFIYMTSNSSVNSYILIEYGCDNAGKLILSRYSIVKKVDVDISSISFVQYPSSENPDYWDKLLKDENHRFHDNEVMNLISK